ncbi:MAG: M23 family metallopeptidase [Pseudomonadales bacterium]|nr:M23 family metallopeptidase [Pseudomonadales bacterium]
MIKTLLFLLSLGLSFSTQATILELKNSELTGQFKQGGMIFGKTEPGAVVQLNGNTVRVTPKGRFVFGFGRDAKANQQLEIIFNNGEKITQKLTVQAREYNIQKIEGVPQKTVTPSPESLARIKKETALVKKARANDSDLEHFLQTFQWPLIGAITGVYGSQRVYNGVPKRPHYGLDIAAPTGTLVYAPADAVITMVHPDMFYSGGTLIMDHGYGISSTFIHLSEVLVKVGDKVKQGDPVGKVGAGGRATGPHLDWRINWYKVRLDPQLLMPAMPDS